MVHASLFTGIGAAEVAAQRLGWTNAFSCEIDDFCNEILKYHYPNTKHYGDITTTDFREWNGKIDVLTAGCPCQPVSTAGNRKGTEDDRYLWAELFRAIREIRPNWVIAENVAGILSMVESCEGVEVESGADLFNETEFRTIRKDERYIANGICESIENEGYRVVPLVIPACGVGAPHERSRVWFIANAFDARIEGMQGGQDDKRKFGLIANALRDGRTAERAGGNGQIKGTDKRNQVERNLRRFGEESPIAHTDSLGQPELRKGVRDDTDGGGIPRPNQRAGQMGNQRIGGGIDVLWGNAHTTDGYPQERYARFPSKSPICGGDDGLPTELHGITLSTWRQKSIKAYGNSMCVDVVYEIFRVIDRVERIVNVLENGG